MPTANISKDSLHTLFLVSSNPRINGSSMRTGVSVSKERNRQLREHPGTIHPFSVFRWYWDIFLTLFLFYILFVTPVQIAFYATVDQINLQMIIVGTIVAIIFFADIALNFRTGILDRDTNRVILDRGQIIRKYISSWFTIDLLSSIPFTTFYDILLLYIISKPVATQYYPYMKIIRLLDLLNIFRLFRIVQCLTRIQKALQIPELHISMVNLITMILTILHWLGCWHWLVADLFNPPGNRKEFSWITRTKLWDKPVWFCYLHSISRAISNMASCGYGGYSGEAPSVAEDIIATILSIMIGATCFVLFISFVGSIVHSSHASEQKFSNIMMEVHEYLRFHNIPLETQRKVVTYFEQRYRRHYFNESAILQGLSDVLRNEILVNNCQHLVEKVHLFSDLPQAFLKELISKLKFEVYLPGDLIIEAGAEGRAMYFIQEGEVEVITKSGQHVCDLQSGDYFGEVSLVTENHETTANVTAKDFCDIYRLEKQDFVTLFREQFGILDNIKTEAKRRTSEIRRINSSEMLNYDCKSGSAII